MGGKEEHSWKEVAGMVWEGEGRMKEIWSVKRKLETSTFLKKRELCLPYYRVIFTVLNYDSLCWNSGH